MVCKFIFSYGQSEDVRKSKTVTKSSAFQFLCINNWQHFNLQLYFMFLSSIFGVKIPRNDYHPIRELLAWKGKEGSPCIIPFLTQTNTRKFYLSFFTCFLLLLFLTFSFETCLKRGEQKLSTVSPFL